MTTAIATHEAGHVVADYRVWGDEFQGGRVTIVPDLERDYAGVAHGPGVERCDNEAYAKKAVLSYLAGYGALIAAGYDEHSAISGCCNDLEYVEKLINSWVLDDLESWKRQAVELMSKPENRKAVTLVMEWLIENETLDGDLAHVLIEVADGESTEEDLQRYLLMSSHSTNRPIPRWPTR